MLSALRSQWEGPRRRWPNQPSVAYRSVFLAQMAIPSPLRFRLGRGSERIAGVSVPGCRRLRQRQDSNPCPPLLARGGSPPAHLPTYTDTSRGCCKEGANGPARRRSHGRGSRAARHRPRSRLGRADSARLPATYPFRQAWDAQARGQPWEAGPGEGFCAGGGRLEAPGPRNVGSMPRGRAGF